MATKILTDAQMLTLAQNVRANDLLLAGRDREDAPEGAGGWRYLLADAMGVARTKANHTTVPTSEVNRLREIDKAARKAASAKAPAKAKPAQVVEIAPPTPADIPEEAMALARMIITGGGGKATPTKVRDVARGIVAMNAAADATL